MDGEVVDISKEREIVGVGEGDAHLNKWGVGGSMWWGPAAPQRLAACIRSRPTQVRLAGRARH